MIAYINYLRYLRVIKVLTETQYNTVKPFDLCVCVSKYSTTFSNSSKTPTASRKILKRFLHLTQTLALVLTLNQLELANLNL